ncbi:hypothetical protein EMIT0P176_130078 [Pseudomonas sp. IT-P176]
MVTTFPYKNKLNYVYPIFCAVAARQHPGDRPGVCLHPHAGQGFFPPGQPAVRQATGPGPDPRL